MDYDRIELEPAPNQFFDDGATPQDEPPKPGSPDSSLSIAYAERVARYEKDLNESYRQIRFGALPAAGHPSHAVTLPGRTVTVIYDLELDRRLLEIYVLHGWDGIRAVQAALDEAAEHPRSKSLHPWPVAKSFFRFTRNRLLLLIRAALIDIERRAADEIVAQLSVTAGLVNDAWTQLDVRATTRDVEVNKDVLLRDTPVYERRTFYTLGNRTLSRQLYPAVVKAVQARNDFAAHEAHRDRLKEVIDYFHGEGSSPPSGKVLDLELAEQWLKHHAGEVDLLYGDIYELCPLAVLGVPLLTLPFSQDRMEQTLGEVMMHFRGEAERLARGLSSRESWLADAVPGLQTGQMVEQVYPSDVSVEESAADHAIENAASDSAYLSLLSEGVLRNLVDAGGINKDSFEYVVLSHYMTHLISRVEQQRQHQERIEALVGLLAKVAALLSLRLWVSPAGVVARGVSVALDVGLLVYQSYSVIHQLSLLDFQISKRLIEIDRRKAKEVVYITELAMMRPEYVKELTQALAMEIMIIVGAKAWPDFKQLVHLRGYYLDLETLIGA